MQSILHQLLRFSLPILPAVYEHLVSLHLGQSRKFHLNLASHLLMVCACCSVKNVELQCHVAKCELHDSIPAIDYRIGSGQKWPSQDE